MRLVTTTKMKHYSEQYRIIVEEIYTLDQNHGHFSAEVLNPTEYLF
jgi:hypothetical protein